ncbi:hypothetical protein, partial [Pseudomonas fluorescens]|uniref:hypothetical protein n=1 Tax=Pseudomonas fluorescens TaxID=294 RepID=UPI001CA6E118
PVWLPTTRTNSMPDEQREHDGPQTPSRLRTAVAKAGAWLGRTVDLRDSMLGVGLVLLAAGLWQVWLPAALIVPGAIITATAIFAGRIDGNAGEG